MKVAVIFGGSGFIGVFFAKHLIDNSNFDRVYLYDNQQVKDKPFAFRKKLLQETPGIIEINGDVRAAIVWQPDERIELIANFAAVHREPGHEDFEYFETNLLGAENVCNWAEQINCNSIIFTSSISPYGQSEASRDELSLPVPSTAYGASKLTAEKIHQTWQAGNKDQRHLVIVRPGVVFGPGEGGNVSRLIKAVIKRYFFYMGNRDTRKAGTYVKELCSAMYWVLERQKTQGKQFSLFNMTMNPGPSIQDYVKAVCHVADIERSIPSVPYFAILAVAYSIELVARPMRIKHPFSPVRIRKLVRSNNILPNFLVENGYSYQHTLESALADWKNSYPEEWR